MIAPNTLKNHHKASAPSVIAKAAVITSPQQTEIQEIELPPPKPGELRIKLEGSGVCASNIPVWEGRDWFSYPIPAGEPGHEGWGVIDAVGDGVENFKVGDRVTALTYKAYATYDMARQEQVVKLPDFLNNKAFPGEPLGCAMNIFSRSDIQKGQKIAVVGCGFLGCLLVQLARAKGAEVIAISRRQFSLDAARKAGAHYTVLMDEHQKVIEKVKEITGEKFCDRVIECTGKEWPLNLSIELTAVRGKLIVAGFHQDGMRSLNMQLLNWRGIDMINAHEREPQAYINGIKAAIKAVQEGILNPFPLFTHTYTLQEMEAAYNDLTTRPDGFIKALILYNS